MSRWRAAGPGASSTPSKASATPPSCRTATTTRSPGTTKALTLYRDIGNRLGEANALKSLGDAALMQGRQDDAIELYRRALAMRREIGDRLGEADTLLGYGRALGAVGSDSAAAVLDDAARIYDLLGRPDRANAARERIAALPQRGASSV